MSQDGTGENQERRDFFISYTGSDRQWAEWIALQLDQAGYTFFIQAWDFRPGSNFVAEMNNAAKYAERTLLVLSPAYLESDYAFAEWAAAFRHDPRGAHRSLVPVRIQPCQVDGLLGSVVFIDLVSLEEEQARERLLAGVQNERARPTTVAFPGDSTPHASAAFPSPLPTIWNIPYRRNPVFTGREPLLTHLAEVLRIGEAIAQPQIQALSGLGGIGKTQIAVEYAYRYRQDYQAVLWVRAGSTEGLNSSYADLARFLNLPQKDAQKQEIIVQAVKTWLCAHQKWLLILDGADEPDLLSPFLPLATGGHILLTTRAADLSAQIAGLVLPLVVETFSDEQGALFLLHRSGLLALNAALDQAIPHEQDLAEQIVREMGGLPLALDLAGAYLAATHVNITAYLDIYRQRHADLLKQRRNGDYPESVATTWNISFERVKGKNPAATELLQLCAYLAPDAIPEEIFTKGASELGPVLAPVAADTYLLNEAVESLRGYSLLARDLHAQTLTIHRLVLTVLRDALPTRHHKRWPLYFLQRETVETQQYWMQRAVQAVSAVFPSIELENWPICERLLPHALTCATWIEHVPLIIPEASDLLNLAGCYLDVRGQYREAEPLLKRALIIRKKQLGPTHLNTAQSFNNLASLYQAQGRYSEAEPLYQHALTICEKQLGPTHPNTAISLNNLGELYRNQGRYKEAELSLKRALAIREQQLETTHPDTALSLNNLAALYKTQGKYKEAEPLYQRALAIREQQSGPTHPDTAQSLNNLGALYDDQSKYGKAKPLYQRALAIREQQLGATHPDTTQSLNNLAQLNYKQGKYAEAEPLFKRALVIYEQQLGLIHPDTARVLNNLAELYRTQRKYGKAEPLYQRALAIREQQLGATHPDIVTNLNNFAGFYYDQGKYAKAEPLFKRALHVCEQRLGRNHFQTQAVRENYVHLLRTIGRNEEAKKLEEDS